MSSRRDTQKLSPEEYLGEIQWASTASFENWAAWHGKHLSSADYNSFFDNVGSSKRYAALRSSILAVLRPEEAEKLKGIPVGVLLVPNVNACTARVPSGGHIITINMMLIGQLVELNSIVILLMAGAIDMPFQEYLRKHQEGGIDALREVTSNEQAMTILRNLVGIQRGFILAHEYSHVLLGHKELDILRVIVSKGQNKDETIPVEVYIRSTEQEYEADLRGTHIMLEVLNEDAHRGILFPALSGLFAFIDYFESAFRLLSIIGDQEADGTPIKLTREMLRSYKLSSHPPAILRIDRLYTELFDPYENKGLNSLAGLAAFSSFVFQEYLKAHLEFLRETGLVTFDDLNEFNTFT